MNNLLHRSKLFFNRNGSTILTCVGGAGVVATTVMAVKATPKAIRLLDEAKKEKGEDLTKMEVVKVAGPAYIPTVITGAATLACIFGANALNQKQQASLASAYALLDNSYKEYKKKVSELHGEDADLNVRNEIVKDKYGEEANRDEQDGKQLFYDEFSQRYFRSTTEKVIQAEYELNKIMSNQSGAYLNEFYELLDIPATDYGNYLGWSSAELYDRYWSSWIDFDHRKVVMDDGLECTIISAFQEPTYDFEDYC